MAITATGVVLCTIAILFWNQLDAVQKALLISLFKEHFAYFFTAAVLMFTAFGFTLDWFFRSYIIPVNQLADEVDLLQSVNPDLRIQIEGSQTVVTLAESINRLVHQKGESRIKGQDLNVQTLRQAVEHWIGLGRSVYPFINQNLLSRALERIGEKLSSSDKVPVERFLLGMPATCMLPAELVPVLDNNHSITGFIILVEDLMIRHQREKEFLMRLQEWRHKLIQSVSAIRATAEVLVELPPDSTPRQADMYKTLVNEASSTANLLKKADWMAELTSAQPWPLTPIDGHEWGRLLQLRTKEVADLTFNLNMENELPSISVDLHHLSITIIFLLQKIKDTFGCDRFDAELFRKGNWIYLDCQWQGDLDFDAFEIWRQEAPDVDNVDFTSSIDEILEMHGARLWVGRRKGERETHGMLLLLPVLDAWEEMQAERRATVLPDHRPEFYDFNLFQQEGQRADQDRYLLNEMSYTVFDTETTGLNPRGGDEIISIGATRIVNGRLLREEVFDQLIDPRREIPWASVRYHGIHPEMLKGKPFIEEVLPHFYQFAKDTILIGHNVA
ncbi:MAG: 3'-5' exonuclease, partial [Desulfosarcinaceae bacterium]